MSLGGKGLVQSTANILQYFCEYVGVCIHFFCTPTNFNETNNVHGTSNYKFKAHLELEVS